MKLRLSALCLAALCALLPTLALANSWGLTGALYEAVASVDTWNDYTTLCRQSGDAAVMGSRYHNVLMLLQEGELRTCAAAVYQPQDKRAERPSLRLDGDTLTLAYGEAERFVFTRREEGFTLTSARVGALRVEERAFGDDEARLYAVEGASSARLQWRVPLEQFHIRLFPRTLEEARHLNQLHASLESGHEALTSEAHARGGARYAALGKGTVPVLSAPFGESSWRAAKGKAAVSLKDELWLLRQIRVDGTRYACIRYNVSERTQRIGYIPADTLGLDAAGAADELPHMDAVAIRATYLTDDPDVSQFAQFDVPESTCFTLMGRYGVDYAYVSAEVRNGRFVDGGQIVWGFVPLRDLALMEAAEASEASEALVGEWAYEAGASLFYDFVRLSADGGYVAWTGAETLEAAPFSQRGAWRVTKAHPGALRYWNDPPYEITFAGEDGVYAVRGLTLRDENFNPRDDTFSLSDWETSGGYWRR